MVDDGSRDETAQIVRSVKDQRVTYVYQENAGQGKARNIALARCRGEYVSLLDSDDYYHPQKIERQIEFLSKNPRYKIVYCNALHVYQKSDGLFYKKRTRHRSGLILSELLTSSYINPNTVLIAREVFDECGGFVEERYYPEEWELWLRMALAGFEFGYLDEDLVTVEIRDHSNTSMEIQPILKRNAISMFERLLPNAIEVRGERYSAKRAVRILKMKLALACLANGQRRECIRAVGEAMGQRSLGYLIGAPLALTPRAIVKRLWRVNQLRNSVSVGG